MSTERRGWAGLVGLFVVLAALFGIACPCAEAAAGPAQVTVVAYDIADDHTGLSPSRHHCGAQPVAGTPATGPGAHPQPLDLPGHVGTRPAGFPAEPAPYPAHPRAPDLHVLQVLRT